MSIFDIFSSRTDRERLSHLKNLVALSMADGKIEKSELLAIAAICNREGVDEREIDRCIKNPSSIDFCPPSDDNKKIQYLKDMVCLMMCDGNIDNTELAVCKLTAEALGFKREVIDVMIMDIIEELKKAMQ